jgi:alpha-1,2-mannosyltransferase
LSRDNRTYGLRLLSRHPAVAAAVVLAGVSVAGWLRGWQLGIDDAVYRAGAWAVLHGHPLYGPLAALPSWPGDHGLPFTYPPVAAALFAPLTLLPLQLAWGALAMSTAVAIGFVVRVSVKGTASPRAAWAGPVTVAGVFALEPVWHTVALGQVNAVLMALVVLDILVLPRSRWSGVLTGLAAAVKLTPLVFVVYLAVAGRRADAVRALGAFIALNAVGAVLFPADTVRFWSSQLLGGNNATTNSWVGNQSLNGLFQRVTADANWAFGAAVLAGLACVGAAMLVARRLHARGEFLGALLVAAFASVLASPISWSHHWIWVVPVVGLLVRRAARFASTGPLVLLVALATVFTGWTLAVVPSGNHREVGWNLLQMVLGNSYVLAALAALSVLAWQLFRGTGTVRTTAGDAVGVHLNVRRAVERGNPYAPTTEDPH